jgi:hypothetical protein
MWDDKVNPDCNLCDDKVCKKCDGSATCCTECADPLKHVSSSGCDCDCNDGYYLAGDGTC